jgi:hypothetical protein
MQRHTGSHLGEPVLKKPVAAKSPETDETVKKTGATEPSRARCQADSGTRD